MALGMSESHAIEKGHRGLNEGSQLASNSDLWNREPPLRQLTGEATILTDGYNLVGPRFDTSGFSALPGGILYLLPIGTAQVVMQATAIHIK